MVCIDIKQLSLVEIKKMLIITISISSIFSMAKSSIKKSKKISYDKKTPVKVQKTIDFNVSPKVIWQVLIILGWSLLILSLLAPNSPLLNVFHLWLDIFVWKTGFFLVSFVALVSGILLFLTPEYLKQYFFKKFFWLIIFLLLIASFPLLDSSYDMSAAGNYGGWPAWVLLSWINNVIFGYNPFFTKIFIMLMFLAYVWYVLRSFSIKINIPKISLNSVDSDQIDEKSMPKWKFVEDFESYKNSLKNNQKSFSIKWVSQKVKKALPTTKIDIEETISSVLNDKNLKTKEEVKSKLREKFLSKDDTKIAFSWDKPCFDASLIKGWDYWDWTDESYVHEKALAVQQKLAEFWINISVEGYSVWPSVIQLHVKPEPGVKLTAIENLKKDLTWALRTKSLRIIAPIPWTEYVWIEILNPRPQLVKLKDLLIWKNFTDWVKSSQTNLIIWKDIAWHDITKPLEYMPHLLVAWATGSWKSVWVNNFILSLIYQNDPSELKFIMVDPKQVELSMYDGLPYLLAPVITQAPKALKVLRRACEHMDYRYWLLRNQKVKDLKEYNAKVSDSEKLYRIVIIIDELADLMMSWWNSKKETENYIARLAQKARAVWLHLIVATQRPSVDVLTWIIKANIPARISFAVVSQVDSRTILDTKWAEDLIWKWDLLYLDPSQKFAVRIQAPYVATDEIEKIADKLKEKYSLWRNEEDFYLPELQNLLSWKNDNETGYYSSETGSWDDEELVEKAIEVISQTWKASATLLQRKLGLGFARASRIMDILEERGIVWPAEWAKPREIFL